MINDFNTSTCVPTHDICPDLLEIHNPPKKLFIKGDASCLTRTIPIAFVGSRTCTSYGTQACETLIQDLQGHPVSIVSGLALGIDIIAHKKALEVGLPTVAVLGSGLDKDVLYPKSHIQIAQRITAEGGCLISEYEDTEKPAPHMFPERNRIIAGIAPVIVIVECEKKSGTMITARLGIESNKEVCVVPHSIFSPTSEGPLSLLKDGAHCICSGKDLLELAGIQKETPQMTLFVTEKEKIVLDLLHEPMSKSTLMKTTNLSVAELQKTLIQLEIKGRIKEAEGYVYKVTS